MTSKNISITEEAYEALLREKRKEESFTQVILRLTDRSGRLSDCFGSWSVSDVEEGRISRELEAGWKQTGERVVSEMS